MSSKMLDGFNYISTTLPSYLKEFLPETTDVTLIYDKQHEENLSPIYIKREPSDKSSNSELDLTGTPLEVDLNGDETFESVAKCSRPDNWSLEESNHVPVSIHRARKAINVLTNSKPTTSNIKPVYCVCDGNDNLRTVVLGAQKLNNSLMTCLVNVVGFYTEDHEFASLKYMTKEHTKNSKPDAKIDYNMRCKFFKHGYNLHNINPDTPEFNGSISIEAIWKQNVREVPLNSNMQMLIVGHKMSSVDFLWDELCLLQSYLDILSDPKKCQSEETVISANFLNESEITSNITELLETKIILEREVKKELNLKDLRQENLMDKLWTILKRCKNLATLRDVLNCFFEILAECENHNLNIRDDKSTIGTIIKGILDGKIAIPTINFAKALELLFELGTEKLKHDYMTILSTLHRSSEESILKKWTKFCTESFPTSDVRRRTSMSFKLTTTNPIQNVKKLAYLRQMHVGVELMFLVNENCSLSEQSMDCFSEKLFDYYVEKTVTNSEFTDVKYDRLCEFSFSLNSSDINLIKCDSPVMWSMKMFSVIKNVQVTTVFHVSEYKIIPTSIYNNYELSIDVNKGKEYYITKLVKFIEYI